ncbi:MAG TPA: cyclic nucleotide-binding and patatin-like phospholipase domain-containing protein [Planctomycetia bacterium]|nr:cyclic nucleotide-binding and patatin-like phospholipase domain-containing protein [Planctomycetia bacterium]
MNLDKHRLCVELQRLDWARPLPESVVEEIAAAAEFVESPAGEVVVSLDSKIEHVYFIVTGRLAGALFDRIGKEILRQTLGRGAVFGLFSVVLPDRSYLHIEALEPTKMARLKMEDLLRLTAKHPDFQLAMFRIAANIVKQLAMVDRDLPKPAVVAVIHHSDDSRPLTRDLTRRLRRLGERPCVAGDEERWRPEEGIPYRLLYENDVLIGRDEVKRILSEFASHERLFIDLSADRSLDELLRVMSYAEVVLWCVRPQDAAAAARKLKELEEPAPRLREKVRIVWLLACESPAPPFVPELTRLAARDFKVFLGQPTPEQGKLLGQGTERIIHHLRGVQIGLALGGGAARGMAHLGVLKSLENHGIFVDMIAGTSAGAMTGTLYAAAMDPEHATRCFKEDLTPSWFFRQLPAGGYWYLLHKYRRRKFEPMLRKYLQDLRLEQLAVPMLTVTVDLVDAIPLVRDSGDAALNILESINLPPLALPIVHSEQAVVDGGLLNNIPANELVQRGCNFVIASSVTASLEKDFMGIRSKRKKRVSRHFASMQVVMRCYMIQGHSMNAVGVQPADYVIAPDVTSFDLSEFTRADEMAVIGERATEESIPRIREMLSKIDPMLFGETPIPA